MRDSKAEGNDNMSHVYYFGHWHNHCPRTMVWTSNWRKERSLIRKTAPQGSLIEGEWS